MRITETQMDQVGDVLVDVERSLHAADEADTADEAIGAIMHAKEQAARVLNFATGLEMALACGAWRSGEPMTTTGKCPWCKREMPARNKGEWRSAYSKRIALVHKVGCKIGDALVRRLGGYAKVTR